MKWGSVGSSYIKIADYFSVDEQVISALCKTCSDWFHSMILWVHKRRCFQLFDIKMGFYLSLCWSIFTVHLTWLNTTERLLLLSCHTCWQFLKSSCRFVNRPWQIITSVFWSVAQCIILQAHYNCIISWVRLDLLWCFLVRHICILNLDRKSFILYPQQLKCLLLSYWQTWNMI